MKHFLLILLTVLLSLSVMVSANPIYELQQDKIQIDNELDRINAEQRRQSQQMRYYTGVADRTERSEAEQVEQLEQFQQYLKDTENEIEGLLAEIAMAEQRHRDKTEKLKGRIVEAYISSTVNIIDILSEAQGIAQLFQKIEIRRFIARFDRMLMEEMAALRKELEHKTVLANELKAQYEFAIQNMEVAIRNMEVIQANAEKSAATSQARIAELKNREAQLYQDAQDLLKQIIELQKAQMYVGGDLLWPLPAVRRVPTGMAAFGNRIHPIFRNWRMHTGIDIGAPTGTSIIAANSGTVILAGFTTGFGNRVVIDHGGGILTLYAHCSRILVQVGESVDRGQVIALVGSTGWSTGPHLHFEVIKDGKHMDPMLFLDIRR